MLIYKILRPAEWEALLQEGETQGAPIDVSDGFVHFSTREQVAETAARHFADAGDLILAAFDADRLRDLRWEPSRGGALFPHLYGPLRLADLRWRAALPMRDGAHVFPPEMHWDEAFIDPERLQFDAFKNLPRDRPIEMLNLVRLRARAAYPDGHDLARTSGAEAYAAYGSETAPILARVGGAIIWRGTFETTLIGPASEVWDVAFIARYPSAAAFLDMVTDSAYQRAVIHRQAAVETSRLIRFGAATGGARFG